MGVVSTEYVEQRDGVYRVAGTRVWLDSIVYAFTSGHSAETIAQCFPVLTLDQVYGAITFYLGHREEVDRYPEAQRQDFEARRAAARAADPMFYQKLADAKRRTQLGRYADADGEAAMTLVSLDLPDSLFWRCASRRRSSGASFDWLRRPTGTSRGGSRRRTPLKSLDLSRPQFLAELARTKSDAFVVNFEDLKREVNLG